MVVNGRREKESKIFCCCLGVGARRKTLTAESILPTTIYNNFLPTNLGGGGGAREPTMGVGVAGVVVVPVGVVTHLPRALRVNPAWQPLAAQAVALAHVLQFAEHAKQAPRPFLKYPGAQPPTAHTVADVQLLHPIPQALHVPAVAPVVTLKNPGLHVPQVPGMVQLWQLAGQLGLQVGGVRVYPTAHWAHSPRMSVQKLQFAGQGLQAFAASKNCPGGQRHWPAASITYPGWQAVHTAVPSKQVAHRGSNARQDAQLPPGAGRYWPAGHPHCPVPMIILLFRQHEPSVIFVYPALQVVHWVALVQTLHPGEQFEHTASLNPVTGIGVPCQTKLPAALQGLDMYFPAGHVVVHCVCVCYGERWCVSICVVVLVPPLSSLAAGGKFKSRIKKTTQLACRRRCQAILRQE